MKVTVLGCGPSGGIPNITGDWGSCDPHNPKNRRSRQSVAVEYNNKVVLIDTSPDLRFQMLDNAIHQVDTVFYTHAHADHCHGIDDLRAFYRKTAQQIPVYASAETLAELQERFGYLFESDSMLYPAALQAHMAPAQFNLWDQPVRTFTQDHGPVTTLGIRIGDMAYSTDLVELNEAAFEALAGVQVWFVECLQLKPHKTHAWLERAMSWVERVRPQQTYFIHMDKDIDYARVAQMLAPGCALAYDGLVVSL